MPDEEENCDDWPKYTLEELWAEGERLRKEGVIEDIVTPFGVLSIMHHPLLED